MMRKRIAGAALALCMLLALLPAVSVPANAAAESWSYAAVDIDGGTPGDQYFSAGDGTSATPYEIDTAQELANLACLINNAAAGYCESTVYYKLTADIALNDWTDDGGFSNQGGAPLPWTPIGGSGNPFRGTLDGGSNTVSGIYISKSGETVSDSYQGLFGYLNGAAVRNVNTGKGSIQGFCYIGGIAGKCEGSSISNCRNGASLTGVRGTSLYLGGVAGQSTTNSTISSCSNTSAVGTLGQYMGGIAGYNSDNSKIEGCFNTADLNGYNLISSYIGGITGYQSTGCTVAYCYSLGTVQSLGNYLGGVVGDNHAAVQSCYHMGRITGSNAVSIGGVAGRSDGTLQNCYNTGSVTGTGTQGIGGVVGYSDNSDTVRYCYNTGYVSGSSAADYAGAIVGSRENTTTLENCYFDQQMSLSAGVGNGSATGSTGLMTIELATGTAFAGFSSGSTGIWTFTADIYPRLSGYVDAGTDYEMDETDAAYVSATPVFLYDNSGVSAADYETCASVTRNFRLGILNSVGWTSGNTGTVSITVEAATICGSDSGGVTLTAALHGVSKTVRLDSLTHNCSVTYSLNGGSGTVPTQSSVAEGGSFPPAASSGFARTGYTFVYWSSGTGYYGAGGIYNTISNDVAFTAIWKADAPSSAPTLTGKTDLTITVTPVPGQEYSMDNGATWQSGNTFTGLSANTAYSIVSRVAGSGIDHASDAGPALSVTTDSLADNDTPSRTITVTETSSSLFSGSRGSVRAEANINNAFFNSVEVRVTDTDEMASGFGLGSGNDVYPFDLSLYIKGTNTRTQPRDGYAVTISLPVPERLLPVKEQLSVVHSSDGRAVTVLSSALRQIGGVWHLVFEATEFSPYALVVSRLGSYDPAAGVPYYLDKGGSRVFIGFAANGTYLAPSGAAVSVTQNTKSFADLSGHWAVSYIGFVTEREIFLGTGRDTFSPDSGMTRAMFATVIGRLYERSFVEIETISTHAFTDCNYDDYHGKYVDWAAENGVIQGVGGGLFQPNRQLTRQEMATMLYRFAGFMSLPAITSTGETLSYSDASSIAYWAEDAALYCQKAGIITGRTGSSFAPTETASRAEVAAIIQRYVKLALN